MARGAERAEESSARAEFRVGAFLVRPRLNRVVAADGRVVQVQPKIMEVLLLLAGRAGEVVTREELFETVWRGTHVSEHVLARAISALRKLFGDDRARPRFIETIPKTGYRLVAPVTAARDDAHDSAHDNVQTSARDGASVDESGADGDVSRGVGRLGLSRGNFWVGMAALTCAAALVLLVVFLITRDAGHAHMHLH
jgi:DNA-binding winged helix-turn-helix (wHTH) protein